MPYLRLSRSAHPKRLETPCLYDASTDDLYELNEEAYAFLRRCDGTRTVVDLGPDAEFLAFCTEEGLLQLSDVPAPRALPPDAPAPTPSLRYLELQLTSRCNLRCAHCCLGAPSTTDLPLPSALDALRQLEEIQGLRALLTGGEPLLYPWFWELNEHLPALALRTALLTNGTLITPDAARRLRVDEVQVSLDGLEAAHDRLRGPGSHRRARAALEALAAAGVAVSVATMVHRANLGDFDAMARELEALGVREWGIDVPCVAGSWSGDAEWAVTPEEAAPCLAHAFGGSHHGAAGRAGCGEHLATLTPEGTLLRCGFFPEAPLGHLASGLRTAWSRRAAWPLEGSRCAACEAFPECGGGCRYRAGGGAGPDRVMCAVYEVEP